MSRFILGLLVASQLVIIVLATKEEKEDEHSAEHKALMPLDDYDKAGFSLISLMTAIAAGGGIGGGGVLVPILILVMGFSIKAAIPLCSCTILGGSIVHIVRNLPRRHPKADRPLIDWTFISLMQPMLIAGAVIGAFLNKLIPDYILAVMLFVILAFTAVRTFSNGMKKWRKENQELENAEALLSSGGDGDGVEMVEDPLVEKSPEMEALLLEDRCFPWFKFSLIVIIFCGVTAMNVAKGSESAGFTPFDIRCGSPEFWYLSLGTIPYCLFFWFIIRAVTVNQYYARVEAGWDFLPGDVEWDEHKTKVYPMVAVFSGLIAGMFGIGGGLINGPLMVELGFNPEVAAATGATMLLFTSTTSTMMYMLFDVLNYEYGSVLVPLGFVSTFFGQLIFNKIMAIYKRDSLIVFTIAFIVAASSVLMGIEGMYVMSAAAKGGEHPVDGICAVPYVSDELSIDPDIHNRRSMFMFKKSYTVNSMYY